MHEIIFIGTRCLSGPSIISRSLKPLTTYRLVSFPKWGDAGDGEEAGGNVPGGNEDDDGGREGATGEFPV